MALTQEQWYKKLKSFVPGWWFEAPYFQEAKFQGMAKLLSELEGSLDDHLKETFICQAEGGYLAEHGNERNLTRGPGELDISFRERIKNIVNSTSCPSIKALVDALIPIGEAIIVEDYDGVAFYNREYFYNRGTLLIEAIYNAFSIIVDKQVHPPYSFFNREYFYDREDFIGQQDSLIELFELIIQAVNQSKALGTVYRLVELQE